jgi:hypothetical protein
MWRLGRVAISALILAYGVLLLCVRVHESATRSRSEAMYAEFLKLKPGETTKAEVGALRMLLKDSFVQDVDCGVTECVYTIGSVWGYSRWYLLTQFAHDHLPSSQLTLRTTGDLLSSASFFCGRRCSQGIRHTRRTREVKRPELCALFHWGVSVIRTCIAGHCASRPVL